MAFNKITIIKVLLLRKLRVRLKRKPRACDIRSIFYNRIHAGETMLVRELSSDPEYHHRYFRMSKETFDDLLHRIGSRLNRKRNHSRPITLLEKLAITLRYLASGNSQISLGMSYRISPSSIGNILRDTMTALCEILEIEQLPKPTSESWQSNAQDFEEVWNFPNCCGAIDGKHIRIRAPKRSGSMNFNYKGYFSMVLLAVVDAKYRFVLVDIGAAGSQSDGGVLSRSPIGKKLQDNELNLPEDKLIGNEMLPHVIVGDDAFPLRRNLLKPYPGKHLTEQKQVFNYRLSRARMVVENAFGILAARWRILHTSIIGDTELVMLIIKTSVLLHNYLMNKRDMSNITADSVQNEIIIPGNWRLDNIELLPIRNQGSNNYTSSASAVRDKFCEFCSGAGSVPWQLDMI